MPVRHGMWRGGSSPQPVCPLSGRGQRVPYLGKGGLMDRVTYSADELLCSVDYDVPLIANGVRCDGGFVGEQYVSPRSAYRRAAIAAWQAQLGIRGLPLLDVPKELIPPHFPNASQAKLLLREGV